MIWSAKNPPAEVHRIAIIGAGTIGAGWVAHYIANGYEIAIWDPDPDIEQRVHEVVRLAWPALYELGLAKGADPYNIRCETHLAGALEHADFVQENAPEQLKLKQELLADIDRYSPYGVVIASSTSGFPISKIASKVQHPERILVGHPYNPPYLIPLVEVTGSDETSQEAICWTEEFYKLNNKRPIVLKQEIPGFLANRLREALWREALHMISVGEATVEQIDAAITSGPGLRWSFIGPCMVSHLAGGPEGIGHLLDHFEEQWEAPWTRLAPPVLDEALREALVKGCNSESGDRSFEDWVKLRDQGLLELLKIKNRLGF